MANDIERAQELVLKEYHAAEGRAIRVWDLIGYAAADRQHRLGLVRISVPGITVRVCPEDAQSPDMFFRLARGFMRPRWAVKPVTHVAQLQHLDNSLLYVRAPAFNVRTGEREGKFRYMFV